MLGQDVGVNFLFVHLACEHSDDKLTHFNILIGFLKTFEYFDCADVNLAWDYIASELNVYFLWVYFLYI